MNGIQTVACLRKAASATCSGVCPVWGCILQTNISTSIQYTPHQVNLPYYNIPTVPPSTNHTPYHNNLLLHVADAGTISHGANFESIHTKVFWLVAPRKFSKVTPQNKIPVKHSAQGWRGDGRRPFAVLSFQRIKKTAVFTPPFLCIHFMKNYDGLLTERIVL